MSSTSCCTSQSSRLGDTFAIGVMVMLAASIVQRSVGLFRSIGFCHFLSDVELGQWALTNSFFVIGVPVAVLGLPGAFGKFSEYYRTRGQLREFCSRVALVSGVALLTSCVLLVLFADRFSWLIYGETKPLQIVMACVVAFAAAAIFSFVNELASSLRLVRIVSLMQFAQSLAFAILGVAAIAYFRRWQVLLPAFAVASLIAVIPGVWALWQQRTSEAGNPSTSVLRDGESIGIWQRILPYAGTLWVLSLLGNLFEVSDRYMLLHLSPAGDATGQALVGQYHAGYILPNLLISLATMLSGILLPYLSADWEAKRFEQIGQRMRQMLITMSLGYTTLAVAAMSAAPILYDYAFAGRYDMALQILPLTLMQATWISLYFICQSYLLCAERGKLLMFILGCGLALNFGLNWYFIQWFGLPGALLATATSNGCVLGFLLWRLKSFGLHLGRGAVVLCLSTGFIAAGPIAATLVLTACVFVAGRTNWLISQQDRAGIDRAIIPRLQRLGIPLESVWP